MYVLTLSLDPPAILLLSLALGTPIVVEKFPAIEPSGSREHG